MKTLMQRILKQRPANRDWNYMEVKELSERMELARVQAQEAIMIYQACKKQYAGACDAYSIQCRSRKWKAA